MSSVNESSLSLDALEQIDQACVAFEDSWKRDQAPEIETYLTMVPDSLRSHLLKELLLIEFTHRERRGELVSASEYQHRFPELATPVEMALQDYRANQCTTQPDGSQVVDALKGQTIQYVGNYEIIEEIARGGMGAVFKARQKVLRRPVALKMILKGQLATEADIERFEREARAVAKLRHPNIVNIHEVGSHEGFHYFTMDFIRGENLADRLREGSMTPRKAASLIQVLAEAIHYAHQQGMLHRDLKPANVLMDEKGTPFLTDFGLAKPLHDSPDSTADLLTETGQVLGTPSYMSPEQASAKHQLVGVGSDVYSLGAILYACLTGRAPFVAESSYETIRQVIHREAVPVHLLNPSIPRDLESICLKCLEKEPHQRYGTAEQLADDLNRFLQSHPVLARPIPATTKAWRWTKRNPAIASLVLLSLLLLTSGSTIASLLAYQAKQSQVAAEASAKEAKERAEEAERERIRADAEAAESERQRKLAESQRQDAITARKAESDHRELAELVTKEAHWQTYLARLRPLQLASEQQKWGHLSRLLEEMIPTAGQPDFRGWEWYFYLNQVQSIAPKISKDRNLSGAFFHDKPRDRLFVWLDDQQLGIWNLEKQKLERILTPPQMDAHSLSVSPNGELLAGGDISGHAFIWNIISNRLEAPLQATSADHSRGGWMTAVLGTAWSPDGTQVVTATRQGDMRCWSTVDWQLVKVLDLPDSSWFFDMDWHPEAGLVSSHKPGIIHVWDVNTWNIRHTGKFQTGGSPVIRWNPSGNRFAVGQYGIGIFNPEAKLLSESSDFLQEYTTALEWLNDNELATGGDGQAISIIDVSSSQLKDAINVHFGRILDISAWKGKVLSGAIDESIRLVSTTNDRAVRRDFQVCDGPVEAMEWGPHANRLATIGDADKGPRVWDSDTFKLLVSMDLPKQSPICDVDWSYTGDQIAGIDASGLLVFYDASTGATQRTLRVLPTDPPPQSPRLDWYPLKNELLISNSRIQLLNTKSSSWTWSSDTSTQWQSNVCVSPSGKLALLADTNGKGRIFDLENRIASRGITFKDYGLGECGWSPDEKLFAIAGSHLTLFETTTLQQVAVLKGHQGPIKSFCFNSIGDRIASGGSDGKVYLWDIATGELLLRIPIFRSGNVSSVRWSPDGRRLALASDDGRVVILGTSDLVPPKDTIGPFDARRLKTMRQLVDLTTSIERDKSNRELQCQQIELLAKLMRWEAALEAVDEFVQTTPYDEWRPMLGVRYAVMLENKNATKKYTDILQDFLRNESIDTNIAANYAMTLALVPEYVPDFQPLKKYAQAFRDDSYHWHKIQPLLLVLLRAQEFDELQAILKRTSQNRAPAQLMVLALLEGFCAHHQGDKDLATSKLEESQKHRESLPTDYVESPPDIIVGHVLSKELSELLKDEQ